MLLDFQPFEVTVRPNLRHWEDPDTGFEVFSNREPGVVHLKSFRSKNLRDALIKNHLLITKGKCMFAYRGSFMIIEGGKEENKRTIIDDPKKELPKIVGAKKASESKVEEKKEAEKPKPKLKKEKEDEYSAENVDEIPILKNGSMTWVSDDKRKN